MAYSKASDHPSPITMIQESHFEFSAHQSYPLYGTMYTWWPSLKFRNYSVSLCNGCWIIRFYMGNMVVFCIHVYSVPLSLMPTQHLDPAKAVACRQQWSNLQRQIVHEPSWRKETAPVVSSSPGHGRGRWPDQIGSWEDRPPGDLVNLNHYWLASQISLYTINKQII